jgi:hypothetical protein
MKGDVAIAFLCKKPNEDLVAFAQSISKKADVYIIVDDNTTTYNRFYYKGVNTIQLADEVLKNKGFYGCNIDGDATHIKKEVIAMDKMLYTFCVAQPFYEYVWVFEDDVFIPSAKTIEKLHKKYCHYDLVTPHNKLKNDSIPDWHWLKIFDKTEPPYHYSMVCAMGLSRAMLDRVQMYVNKNKRLFYQEAMFNTLAMKHNLKVKDAPELKTIVWKGDWGLIPFMCLPSNLFHPVKDTDKHSIFRAVLKENRGRVDAKKIVSSLNDNTLNFLKQVINMEEQLKGLESELAELNAELLLCEKEIQKRNDKQKDYLLQKGEILQDIEIVKEEINMVKLMIESGTTEDGYETILGETPEELPTELGGIKLESENKEVK